MALNDQRTISEMGIISDEVYDNDPSGVKYFKDNPETMLVDTQFGITAYTVIDYTSTDTNMQALLLQKSGTNEYVIAFRGTETETWSSWDGDVAADLRIGLQNYNPQYQDALAFVQSALNDPKYSEYNITTDNLTLTGHSLGGILTQAVGAVLGIESYAFNPYGTERLLTMPPNIGGAAGLLDVYRYAILNAFGLDSSYAESAKENVLNIMYSDFGALNGDILSNLATALTSEHLGEMLPIFGDNVGLDGHYMSVVNKAVQHYNEILVHFTDTTTMESLSRVYLLSGENGYDKVEEVFVDLNVLAAADHSLSLNILAGTDSEGNATPPYPYDLENLARTDIAYRYALVNLNPFVVVGADYSSFNQNGELDIYNPSTGEGQLTDLYLTYRSEMLSLLIEKNIHDYSESTIYFEDKTTGEIVFRPDLNAPLERTVVFGSEQGEELEGSSPTDERPNQGDRDDFLFGMGGNDTLKGYGGDDYLEGGNGEDTLIGGEGQDVLNGGNGDDTFVVEGADEDYDIFIGGEGEDTILGSDGNDTIRVHELTPGDSIEIIDGGGGDKDLLAGTLDNDVIALIGTTVTGIYETRGEEGNDYLMGNADQNVLLGGAGDDYLFGGDEATYLEGDYLEGGAGNDYLDGGAGNDRLIGGAGNNMLMGDAGDDDIIGQVVEAEGENYLWGESGNDVISGGFGSDKLYGGFGDDYMLSRGGGDVMFDIKGYDRYFAMDGDIIEDSDGLGRIQFNLTITDDLNEIYDVLPCQSVTNNETGITTYYQGDTLGDARKPTDGADYWVANSEQFTYQLSGSDLIVTGTSGQFTIKNFNNGDFGITLKEHDGSDSQVEACQRQSGTTASEQLTGDQSANNVLYGNGGADTLIGGNGHDALVGDADNDILIGGGGDDILFGGDGSDTAQYSGALSDYNIYYVGRDLYVSSAGEGTDRLYGVDFLQFSDQTVDLNAPLSVGGIGAETQENTSLTLTEATLLSNTSAYSWDEIRVQSISDVQNGSVVQGENGDYVFTPDENFSGTANLSFWVMDARGRMLKTFAEIAVTPVADIPLLEVSDAYGNEDEAISLSIQAALVDQDGSEHLEIEISGVPAGATLSAGTTNGNGRWVLTADQLDGLTLSPPHNFDTDFVLNVTARSTETDGSCAEVTEALAVTVNGVPDAPELIVSDAVGNEDSRILLNVQAALGDLDGSESLEVEISGVPPGALLSAGINNGDGRWTLTADQLNGLALIPPDDSDDDITLNVVARSIEADGGVAEIADTLFVTVNGVSDTPSLIIDNNSFGYVNSAILLNFQAALNDQDGSESLEVDFSGVPEGAYLSAGVDNGDGRWTVTADQLNGLTLTPPENAANDFYLNVVVRSIEASGGAAEISGQLLVVVRGLATPPVLDVSDSDGDENAIIPLVIQVNQDGSASLQIEISGVPEGASLSAGVDNGDGRWILTADQLPGLTLSPPFDSDENISLTVNARSTAIDGSFADSTANLSIIVNAVIEGTEFDDELEGIDERDTLYGADGNDTLKGGGGNDSLYGGAGGDILEGGAGDDLLYGESGNDDLRGEEGDDLYFFEEGFGQDSLFDLDGSTIISFGEGILPGNVLIKRNSSDLILSIADTSDQLTIRGFYSHYIDDRTPQVDGTPPHEYYFQLNCIKFFDGTTWDEDYLDSILDTPTNGDDFITGAEGNEVIDGLDGNDTIYASSGEDILYGGLGDDLLHGGAGNDILYGGLGDDQLDGYTDDDLLYGGEGQDYLNGSQGNDTLYGESGNDDLAGGDGNDHLFGGDGDDHLLGQAGDDFLDGGSGNDRLEGLNGNDTYFFGRGSGQDIVNDAYGDGDVLCFGEDIAPEDITITRDLGSIILTISGTADQLRIEDWFDDVQKIESFVFADGTIWDLEQIEQQFVATQVGTAEADTLTGVDDKNNDISGLDGNDIITGSRLDDVLRGGEGDDILNGNGGNDFLVGGAGDDLINAHDKVLWYLNGQVTIEGGAGDDIIFGGYDNKTTYLFSPGDGQDTILDFGGYGDTVSFKEGISPGDVQLVQDGNDLLLILPTSGDQIRIQSCFGGKYYVYTDPDTNTTYYVEDQFSIEQVQFADGTLWDYDAILEKVNHKPEVINALEDQEVRLGNRFDFQVPLLTFSDPDSNDVLTYSASLEDGSPLPEWLNFDGVTATFSGTPGSVDSGQLNIVITASDQGGLVASDGFQLNILRAAVPLYSIYEEGRAVITTAQLISDMADDTLSVQDLAVDHGTLVETDDGRWIYTAEADWLGPVNFSYQVNDGATSWSESAILEVLPDKMDLGAITTGTSITVSSEQLLSGLGKVEGGYNVTDLTVDNGILMDNGNGVWTLTPESGFTGKVQISFVLNGSSGENRTEYAVFQVFSEDVELILGSDNEDSLASSGSSAVVVFDGGAGDDTLQGTTESSDIYRFGRGSGQDTISDGHYGMQVATNVVQFKEGVSIYDLELNLNHYLTNYGSSESSFIIKIKNTEDRLVFSKSSYIGFFYDHNYLPEQFEFADGSIFTPEQLVSFLGVFVQGEGVENLYGGIASDTIYGSPDSDTIYGREGNDFLFGFSGEDHLEGEAGNDILDGGQGNDWLSGGSGDDCYLFAVGSGQDHIYDGWTSSEGSNIVRFSEEISPENVAVCQQDTNLCLILRNTEDQLIIDSWFSQDQYQAFQIEFSDGTCWDAIDLNAKAALGVTNAPPELANALLDQELSQGNNLNYQIPTSSFNDPDAGDNLIYSASLEDGRSLPSWLNFDTSTGTFSGTPSYIDVGVLSIKVTATDMFGARISDVFSLTVNSMNIAPTVNGPVSLGSLLEDGSLSITSAALLANAADGNGDNLSVSNLTVNTGSVVDNGDGTWTYQPNANEYGSVTFCYSVSDGFESVAATANLDVTAVNDAPMVGEALIDQTISEGSVFSYQIPMGSFTDPDQSDSLSYSVALDDGSALPAWLTFDSATGSFCGSPSSADIGTLTIKVTAADSEGLSVSNSFSLIVENSSSGDPTDIPPASNFDNVVTGTDYAEQLVGTGGVDLLQGLAGDDQLFGLSGNDWLVAGDGADYLDGGAGDDIQLGEAGDDQLGGDTGNDILVGGTGNDTYVYRPGSGADVIDNSDGGTDWLIFTDDITADRLTYLQSDDDLIVRIDGNEETQVKVSNWFADTGNQLAYIQPAGGYGISAADINALFDDPSSGDPTEIPPASDFDNVVKGTDSAEQLVGTGGIDLLQGLAGDDQLFGLSGNDWLVAGDGADYLDGGAGDDIQLGEAGDDQLGGDAGNDTLIGGAGNDIYVYRPGSGADIINNSGGGTDWLIFTDDITADRLTYLQLDDDLIVRIDGNDQTQVTVSNWFADTGNQLAYIQPAGGYGISAADINALFGPQQSSSSLFSSTAFAAAEDDAILTSLAGARAEGPADSAASLVLADGSFMTDADINQIIQEMSAYATAEGIAMDSLADVRQNEELMAIVANHWQAA